MGLLIGLVALGLGFWAWSTGQLAWQTMILTTVIFSQVLQAHTGRSSRDSVFRMNPLSNRPLLLASAAIVLLQLIVIYAEPLHRLFETVALTPAQLGLTVLAALVILAAGEVEKAIRRRNRRASDGEAS